MENLQEQVRTGLRRGDVAARCSVSQYILMLPQANYENSCMVCRRLIKGSSAGTPILPPISTTLCSLWNRCCNN